MGNILFSMCAKLILFTQTHTMNKALINVYVLYNAANIMNVDVMAKRVRWTDERAESQRNTQTNMHILIWLSA